MSLRPLLADFARPYGRLYEYRFYGNKEWQLVRDGEDLRIPDLFLVRHHLEIRLDGVPGTMTRYTITVSPSGWAIIELLLLIASITALLLWLRYKKNTTRLLAERNDIEDALIEAETERQVKQMAELVEEADETAPDNDKQRQDLPSDTNNKQYLKK